MDIGANLGKSSEQDLASQLVRASAAGVSHVILTGCSVKGSQDAQRICQQWSGAAGWERALKHLGAAARYEFLCCCAVPSVELRLEASGLERLPRLSFTCGVHPHDAKSCNGRTLETLRALAQEVRRKPWRPLLRLESQEFVRSYNKDKGRTVAEE